MKNLYNSTISKNLIANIFGVGIQLINQVILIPLYLIYWPIDLYSDWIVITALSAFFSMSDMGLNSVTQNQFSISYNQNRLQECESLLTNNYILVFCMGILMTLGSIIFVTSFNIIQILNLHYLSRIEASIIFILLLMHIFIGMGSIIFPQLTVFSVLWILEAYRFQSLTLRSFCGALLGWMLPYWFLFGHAFFYNEMDLFYRPFIELSTFGEAFHLQTLQSWELAILGYLLILFIVSAVHCIAAGFEDKIRTRAYLQFLIDLTIFLFLLIALQPIYCSALLPLLIISNSILIGHFFVLTNSKSSNVFFIISLVGLILLFAFNIWTLL